MYPLLQYAVPNTLDVGGVSRLQAQDRRSYLGRSPAVETIEPTTERTVAQAIDVFSGRNYRHMAPIPGTYSTCG